MTKKRINPIIFTLLTAFLGFSLLFTGIQDAIDSKDIFLSPMIFAIPGVLMLLNCINYFRFAAYRTLGAYLWNNLWMTFLGGFLLELIYFLVIYFILDPLERSQIIISHMLLTILLITLVTAVLLLIISAIFGAIQNRCRSRR